MVNERTAARRERRIAARREQILDAAARMFAEKGFHRATTREIAEAADVSEGTIYNYFASKNDLLIGMMTRMGESQVPPEMFEQGILDDAREFYVALLQRRHVLVRQNKSILQAVLSEILTNQEMRERYNEQIVEPYLSMFEQYLRAQVEQGQMRPVDVALTTRYLFALNLGLLGMLILGDPLLQSKWESDELLESLAGFIFDGLEPQEAVE